VSQRRACQALNIDRSTVRYTSIGPDDGPLREAIKAVAAERRRFGYRRIHIMLERQVPGTPAYSRRPRRAPGSADRR
jgi:putative transposase